MVSLAVVVPALGVILVRPGWRRFLAHALSLGVGGFLGLAPYLVGLWRFSGAQGGVSGTRSLGSALESLWSPTLTVALPATLGIGPGLFPDSKQRLEFLAGGAPAMGLGFMLVLIVVTLILAVRLSRCLIRREWPTMGTREIVVGTAWLGLGLFVISARSGAHTYRYLTPVAWGFPFLVACLWRELAGKTRLRTMLAGGAVLLALINVMTIGSLVRAWRHPEFAPGVVAAPDLRPALDWLKARGIRFAVASHWAAYRINFLTGGKIVCSQPMNERFPGWPVPYKKTVEAAAPVAYVLTDRIRFLTPSIFDRHLATMGVQAEREPCGLFTVYHGFRSLHGTDRVVDLTGAVVTASHRPDVAHRMTNGDRQDRWSSDTAQTTGMWVQVDLPAPIEVGRLVVYRGHHWHDYAGRLRLEALTPDGWTEIPYEPGPAEGKFRFENGQPIYGSPASRTLCFAPVTASALRLTIAEPRAGRSWTLTEIEAFTTTAGVPGGSGWIRPMFETLAVGDTVGWDAPHGVENMAQVFADDPQNRQNHAAQKGNQDGEGGPAHLLGFGRVVERQFGDDHIGGIQKAGDRDHDSKDDRQAQRRLGKRRDPIHRQHHQLHEAVLGMPRHARGAVIFEAALAAANP
jgi:hypothetical protein